MRCVNVFLATSCPSKADLLNVGVLFNAHIESKEFNYLGQELAYFCSFRRESEIRAARGGADLCAKSWRLAEDAKSTTQLDAS